MRSIGWMAWLVATCVLGTAPAAELTTLRPTNWDQYAPQGKEVDAVYGDFVLRNNRISAVIANHLMVSGRSSSRGPMGGIGGCIIDLTLRDQPNDQLTAYFPGPRRVSHQYISEWAAATGDYRPDFADDFIPRQEKKIVFDLPRIYPWDQANYASDVRYTLADDWPYVLIEVTYHHPSDLASRHAKEAPAEETAENAKPADDVEELLGGVLGEDDPDDIPPEKMTRQDYREMALPKAQFEVVKTPEPVAIGVTGGLRADHTFDTGTTPDGRLAWAYDKWNGAAYGILAEDHQVLLGDRHAFFGYQVMYVPAKGENKPHVAPGKTFKLTRKFIPAHHLLELRTIANALLHIDQQPLTWHVRDGDGPIADSDVVVTQWSDADRKFIRYGHGRTNAEGAIAFSLPPGSYKISVTPFGRAAQTRDLVIDKLSDTAVKHDMTFDALGHVVATITNTDGQPTPCKVQFQGVEGTPDPYFSPDDGDHRVVNLIYTHTGSFRQALPSGTYRAVITYGPEYDVAYQTIKVEPGKDVALKASLRHVVNTPGWIIADLHSHSTISGYRVYTGQSTAGTLGRVLNLLCENIEFAPATEHEVITTYQPLIEQLGVAGLIKSCTGIGFTDGGRKYAYNEQNAFPLPYMYHEHWQDGGAPQRPHHCMQLNWLAAFGAPIDMNAPWDTAKFKGRYDGPEKLITILQPKNTVPRNPYNNNIYYLWAGEGAHEWPMFTDTDEDGRNDEVATRFYNYMDALDVRSLLPLYDPQKYPRQDNDILDWLDMLALGYRVVGVHSSGAYYNQHGSGGQFMFISSPTDRPAEIEPMDVVHAVKQGQVVMSTGPFVEATVQAKHDGQPVSAGIGGQIIADHGQAALHVRVQAPNWINLEHVQVLFNSRVIDTFDFTPANHPEMFRDGALKFDQTLALDLKEDAYVIVVVKGSGPNLRRMNSAEETTMPHMAVTNPIYIDADGRGFRPQAPPDDQVVSKLEMIRPVLTSVDAKPGLVRLTLTNHGQKEAKHTVRIRILPKDDVSIIGKNEFTLTVPPGQSASTEFELGISLAFATEAATDVNHTEIRLYVPRSSADQGLRPTKLVIPLDFSPKDMSSFELGL